MKNTLEQFAKLKAQLTEERDALTTRLAAINAVLGNADLQAVPEIPRGVEAAQFPTSVAKPARTGRRGTGKLTLAQAVLDAFEGEKGNGKTIAALLPLVQATAGKTHKVNRVTVNLACLRLRDTGKLKNPERGVYALV